MESLEKLVKIDFCPQNAKIKVKLLKTIFTGIVESGLKFEPQKNRQKQTWQTWNLTPKPEGRPVKIFHWFIHTSLNEKNVTLPCPRDRNILGTDSFLESILLQGRFDAMKSKKHSPKWWFNGNLPWYKIIPLDCYPGTATYHSIEKLLLQNA